eukprot:TRINITY_DN3286_c0_g1_i3.p1 TRINITY_DN3286_c0_g1~~TRINITY_DN3286_c0_g1_i3.p1  ORF type:complete len:295 (+),score=67.71 TRINITY_DN3286_c0_g1_i3:137-1021(+)
MAMNPNIMGAMNPNIMGSNGSMTMSPNIMGSNRGMTINPNIMGSNGGTSSPVLQQNIPGMPHPAPQQAPQSTISGASYPIPQQNTPDKPPRPQPPTPGIPSPTPQQTTPGVPSPALQQTIPGIPSPAPQQTTPSVPSPEPQQTTPSVPSPAPQQVIPGTNSPEKSKGKIQIIVGNPHFVSDEEGDRTDYDLTLISELKCHGLNGVPVVISKRFTDFESFYKQLVELMEDRAQLIPEFPSRTWSLFGRYDEATIKTRTEQFQKIMDYVCEVETLREHFYLDSFFNIPEMRELMKK